MLTLATLTNYLQNRSQINKYMSNKHMDVILARKNTAGRSSLTQRSCRIQNMFIYREPMVALGQLVTLGQFILKPIN